MISEWKDPEKLKQRGDGKSDFGEHAKYLCKSVQTKGLCTRKVCGWEERALNESEQDYREEHLGDSGTEAGGSGRTERCLFELRNLGWR